MVGNFAASSAHYPFDNTAPQAGERFARLAELYDGTTRRHLDRLGIGAGWRCLEVGAGNGSIARFMSERVDPAGHVVATDINTDWLPASLAANVDVSNHDISVDPLAEGAFDLIHARAVLKFLPDRKGALTRMIAALKPGGWLLAEELVAPVAGPAHTDSSDCELANKSRRAIEEVIRCRGGDPAFGRDLPAAVLATDLVDVGAEGYFVPIRTEVDQIGADIVATGVMTSAELARYRATLNRPGCLYPASMALISVWGRRPLS